MPFVSYTSHQGKIRGICELWDGVWPMITFTVRVTARAKTQVLSSYILPSEKEGKNRVALCLPNICLFLKSKIKCFSVLLELLELNNLDIK